jgi:hypothetical protein
VSEECHGRPHEEKYTPKKNNPVHSREYESLSTIEPPTSKGAKNRNFGIVPGEAKENNFVCRDG